MIDHAKPSNVHSLQPPLEPGVFSDKNTQGLLKAQANNTEFDSLDPEVLGAPTHR